MTLSGSRGLSTPYTFEDFLQRVKDNGYGSFLLAREEGEYVGERVHVCGCVRESPRAHTCARKAAYLAHGPLQVPM